MAVKQARRRSLIKNDALAFQQHYFKEVLQLYGIDAMYYEVIDESVKHTVNGEFSCEYKDPCPTQLLFDQVPKVSTLKKLGWTTELDQSQPLVHLDFDLPNIRVGAAFCIEDPLRPGKGRMFRVTKMSTGIIYPMCVTAQIVAVLGDMPEKTLQPEKAEEINKEKGWTVTRPSREYD